MSATEIREIRSSLGLTQAQMAQLLNVHPVTVSRWESEAETRYRPSAYQETLLDAFRKAAKDPEVKRKLRRILLGLGIGAALFFLLKGAFGELEF